MDILSFVLGKKIGAAGGGGGGGGEGLTLLKTQALGTISGVGTTPATTGVTVTVNGINDYDLLLFVTSADTVAGSYNYHIATISAVWVFVGNTNYDPLPKKRSGTPCTARWHLKINAPDKYYSMVNTSNYGIYPHTNSVTVADGTLSAEMYVAKDSTSTGTISADYTTRVYGVKLYDMLISGE